MPASEELQIGPKPVAELDEIPQRVEIRNRRDVSLFDRRYHSTEQRLRLDIINLNFHPEAFVEDTKGIIHSPLLNPPANSLGDSHKKNVEQPPKSITEESTIVDTLHDLFNALAKWDHVNDRQAAEGFDPTGRQNRKLLSLVCCFDGPVGESQLGRIRCKLICDFDSLPMVSVVGRFFLEPRENGRQNRDYLIPVSAAPLLTRMRCVTHLTMDLKVNSNDIHTIDDAQSKWYPVQYDCRVCNLVEAQTDGLSH